MPLHGYTKMLEKILDHSNITIDLATPFKKIWDGGNYKRLIFTGPIDEYFDYCYGKLPYRSLHFEHKTLGQEWVQPVATINYPQTEAYTRITEYKHLTGQVHAKTSITYEYPIDDGDPYYPVPRQQNYEQFKRYETLALATPDVWFAGRLATYRYYNMDQIVGQALATFKRINETIPKREKKYHRMPETALSLEAKV